MPLAPGARIGGYEIIAMLGAGGMGEVYRARDARLDRDVAIKVLSPAIAADADGLMRFDREARMLASLNHPNIAAIYGVEDRAGFPALVLELVDGETLADRIARGRVPVVEALEYAKQIAEALDAAHEAGVVHRDLKPGNIKITENGTVKVLDFGLAKAIAAAAAPDPAVDPAHSPTVTVHGTKGGVILGTAAYMSPEQARGKPIDKRTDIWAFGCVLYEMLTGTRTFRGETTSDVIAAIIERQPDMSTLPAALPPHVRRVIERCLEKDLKRRARDIADVALQLDEDRGPADPGRMRPALRRAGIAAAAILIVALAALASRRWSAAPAPAPTLPAVEFTISPPAGHVFAADATVSPDGKYLAFQARDQQQVTSLWIRPIDTAAARRLQGTEGAASPGIWSPDGRFLAFLVGDSWKRVSADGGPVVTIVSGVLANLGASWGPDGTILLAPANRTFLARVPAAGGSLEPVTTLNPDQENSHRWPRILPDGRHFLFTARSDRPENLGIKIGSFGSNEVRPLVRAASPGVYAEPGWLVFMTPDQNLMAQRLDPRTWSLSGDPQPIAASVRYNGPSFNGAFDASLDGRVLTYAPASRGQSILAWFDRGGKSHTVVGPERRYRAVHLSPNGRSIAVELVDDRYGTRDIWLLDTTTNALTRLTTNPATDWRPVFSPDGRELAFASDRAGASTVYRTRLDRPGSETVFYRHPNGGAFPADWSRDGKQLIVQVDDSNGRPSGVLSVPIDGGSPTPLIQNDPVTTLAAQISPDGSRIAFVSVASGEREVYVATIADGRRVRVSAEGGMNPHWGSNGRELLFQNARDELMVASLSRGMDAVPPPTVLLRPCEAIGRVFGSVANEIGYDVSPDGTRILARCDPPDANPQALTVVVNWQSRLR
ncbi:MAG TPA: protein kinase [Vicinamibacterales bacterium]